MYEFLNSFEKSLYVFNASISRLHFEDGNPKPTFITNFDDLWQSSTTLMQYLKPTAEAKINSKDFINIKDSSNRNILMPVEQARKFEINLNTFTSSYVSSDVPSGFGILSKFGFSSQLIRENTALHIALDKLICTLIDDLFNVIKNVNSEKNINYQVKNLPFDLTLSRNKLKQLVESTEQVNTDLYEELIKRANHLSESIHQDEREKVEKISNNLKAYKSGFSENISGILRCVAYPPEYWEKILNNLEHHYQVGSTWENNVRDFDRYLSNNKIAKSSEHSLALLVERGIFTFNELHISLNQTIELWRKCKFEFQATKTELGRKTASNITKETVTKELSEIKISQQNLFVDYKKTRKSLIDKLVIEIDTSDISSSQKEDLLHTFSSEVEMLLQEFLDQIQEAKNSGVITHSGPAAAMMIGLGQGGEAIVRAAMAKMLNNHTDTRCSNVLSGLNINMNDVVKAVMPQKQDPREVSDSKFNFSVDATDKDEKVTRCFNDANIIAINAGPEQGRMLEQKYNYIWGRRGGQLAGAKKDSYIKLSENSILVDSNAEGSGGKMGKGRSLCSRRRTAY